MKRYQRDTGSNQSDFQGVIMAEAILASGIYAITNSINGKVYIGSAIRFNKRWSEHRRTLNIGSHHSRKLQRSWNKHGADAFVFSILFSCEPKNLIFYEQRAIDRYEGFSKGYNTSPTAGNSLGVIRSEETKAKLSAAFKGRKLSPEHGAKIGAAQIGKKKAPRSPERVAEIGAAISARNKGRKLTPEQKENHAVAMLKFKGYKHSQETLEQMSIAQKGRIVSDETRAKLSAANIGNKHTPESCEKIRLAGIGRTMSAEARAKIAEAQRNVVRGPMHAATKAALIAANTGRTKTESEIAALRAANLGNTHRLGKPVSDEQRAKTSAALKGRTRTPEQIENIKRGLAAAREARNKTM